MSDDVLKSIFGDIGSSREPKTPMAQCDERLRLAAELSAAIQAHEFFKTRGSEAAQERLAKVIQRLASDFCNRQEAR